MAQLAAVLLAAGAGVRLRPLTSIRPKALCPVGNVALLDRALRAVAELGFTGPEDVAVNAWHLADQVVEHVGTRAHVGRETGPEPLGTAGGLAALRDWIGGRDVLVGNADAYLVGGSLSGLTDGWDASGPGMTEVRMLGVPAADRPAEFGRFRFAGFSVIPWRYVATLSPEPSDLVSLVWRRAEAAGEFRIVEYGGTYLDCGTPEDYLTANLHAADGRGSLVARSATVSGTVTRSVVGDRAFVAGAIDRCVVWPDAVVADGEHLSEVIRYGSDPADTLHAATVQPTDARPE